MDLQDKPETTGAPRVAEDRAWRCVACGAAVARASDRIDLDGASERAFVNPGGTEYVILGFREAPGCAAFGEASSYWTWFPGYAWQVAICGVCGVHLGWSFTSAERRFYGLIRERIAEA